RSESGDRDSPISRFAKFRDTLSQTGTPYLVSCALFCVRELVATGTSDINRYIPHIFTALVCGVSISHAGPAAAQDLRPGIIGEDKRVIVVDEGPPWDAIGQVNISGYRRTGMCTG